MTTSDGISDEDRDILRELAVEVVNAEPGEEKDVCRRQLLEYLDELQDKYGHLPSILATGSDYLVEDTPGQLALLDRAYTSAAEVGDRRNQLHIAARQSICCAKRWGRWSSPDLAG